MKHQKSLAMIPVLTCLLLGLVASASVANREPGRKTSQEGSGLEAKTVWPDKQFIVDAAGNISPQQDYLHSGQKAVWTFATASPANALVRQTWINPNNVAAPGEITMYVFTQLCLGVTGIAGEVVYGRDSPCYTGKQWP